MYQILCDNYILYDPRDEELCLLQPKCKLEANTVGEGSFTILSSHPFYEKLQKLKSVFEIRQDNEAIFRGRMTTDSKDFNNMQFVDLEGILACTNDTYIPPFNFPGDSQFADAAESANKVEYFLQWLLSKHNERAESWQQLKLGTVTVTAPNNVLVRESSKYIKTWSALQSKLFESSLGGYLCVRYEEDGNYVDYLESFELTNTQKITLGENLLDINRQSDASQTYSAILPVGADGITLASLEDGAITEDLIKDGVYIYSLSAVKQYGWIVAPLEDSTWDDVTDLETLQQNAMERLTGTGMLLSNTITIRAVDLHCTDEEIQRFRIYRNILVDSPAHELTNMSFPLTLLDIDILNPQNTEIVIGDTMRSLVAMSNESQSTAIDRIDRAAQLVETTESNIQENVQQQLIVQETSMTATASEMILSALQEYVQTGEYSTFKETVETQLQILADEIALNFATTTQSIDNVDGDLQAKFNQVYKHISFSADGIAITSGDSVISLELDNDMIVFKKNGLQFGYWDGTDFHTGNIVVDVNERAQFGNFAFVPRSDGSLMFLKVKG